MGWHGPDRNDIFIWIRAGFAGFLYTLPVPIGICTHNRLTIRYNVKRLPTRLHTTRIKTERGQPISPSHSQAHRKHSSPDLSLFEGLLFQGIHDPEKVFWRDQDVSSQSRRNAFTFFWWTFVFHEKSESTDRRRFIHLLKLPTSSKRGAETRRRKLPVVPGKTWVNFRMRVRPRVWRPTKRNQARDNHSVATSPVHCGCFRRGRPSPGEWPRSILIFNAPRGRQDPM